jgi:hypothetical protein
MRIISTFRDYYDSVLAYGFDDSFVYMREHRFVDLRDLRFASVPRNINDINDIYDVTGRNYIYDLSSYGGRFVVSFCNKTYIGRKMPDQSYISYKPEEVDQFMVCEIKSRPKMDWYTGYVYEHFLKETKDIDYGKLHYEYQTPVLVVADGLLHINPKLEDLEFFRAVEPYTAFQEIEMYLSGILGKEAPNLVEISDKSKILKHGHDPKYSFRKMPKSSSKKSNRKN